MFRVYLEFAKKSFQKRIQYRVTNLAGLSTNFFFAAVRAFVFMAFYQAQTIPQPLNLNEVVTYVCLTQAFLMVMPLWHSSEIADTIKDGSVSVQLMKPVGFQGYWFADESGKAMYYIIMRTVPTLILAKFILNIQLPIDFIVIASFLLAILLMIVLGISINIVTFGTTFWTLDPTGVRGFVLTIMMLFSGFLVPVALWPEWLQKIANWLPFKGLIDVPFSIYLGKLTGYEMLVAFGKQFLWIVVFIILGRLILQRGFSRLVIQGG